MSTHNICFYGELTKIILQLSSNTLLICSSEYAVKIVNIGTLENTAVIILKFKQGGLEHNNAFKRCRRNGKQCKPPIRLLICLSVPKLCMFTVILDKIRSYTNPQSPLW